MSILDTRMVAEMVLRERSRVAEWRGGEECWGIVLEKRMGMEKEEVEGEVEGEEGHKHT